MNTTWSEGTIEDLYTVALYSYWTNDPDEWAIRHEGSWSAYQNLPANWAVICGG